MIKVSHLTYEYPGKQALKDVCFSIPPGSVTALVGPNGAGKTTLLRCLAAIEEPFSGQIEIAGIDVNAEPRKVHRVLGYLSDFFGLYEDLSVKQSLTFAAWLHAIPADQVDQHVTKAAELLGLMPWFSHKVKTLSRGWRQRLGIAQAIIHNPKIVLLDEPAAGLDPEARIALSHLFRDLKQQGMTIVVSSHILAELEDYCTSMLVLRDGVILEHRENSGQGEQALTVRVTFAKDADKYKAQIDDFPGVTSSALNDQNIKFRYRGNENELQSLLKLLVNAGAPVKNFDSSPERLQDVYLSLGNKGKISDAP